MKKFTIPITIVVILFAGTLSLNAQDIHWQDEFGKSQVMAVEENKLILAYFWASWCIPCQEMDKMIWADNTIVSLTRNYIPGRFILDEGWENAEPFYVDKIPAIMIVDYRGEVLYKTDKRLSLFDMQELLSSFPGDVKDLYTALGEVDRESKNPEKYFQVAAVYSGYAMEARHPFREKLLQESDKMLKKSKRYIKKKKNPELRERIEQMLDQNRSNSGKEI